VSKTNLYTLFATALLGVLLFVVLQFTRNIPTAPPTVDAVDESPGRRLAGFPDLHEFLTEQGLDGMRLVAESARWRQARGFLGSDRLLNVSEDNAPSRSYQALDTAALENRSEGGEMAATQTLAARTRVDDPFASMDLYATAAAQGSVYAMIQIGSLRETLGNMPLDRFDSGPAYRRKLGELRDDDSSRTLQTEAFGYVAAAVRDGGAAVVDEDLLGWLQRMEKEIPSAQRAAACELSERIFMGFSAARRSRGLAPLTTTPPPVFIAIPNLDQKLPCRATPYPIFSLIDLSRCSVYPVENERDDAMDLYICQLG
jgi:hypothetical protein